MGETDTSRLISAIVAAFPGYIRDRLDRIGVAAGSTVEEAVAAAGLGLRRRLSDLLAQPSAEQTDSPLELVRAATRSVTDELVEMGLRPPTRDAWLSDQYPEDVFDLYPASSQDLGEEAWRLHLEWGKTKARTVAGVVPAGSASPSVPTVGLFGVPTEEREEIVAAVAACGYQSVVWRNPAALEQVATLRPVLVLVDVRHAHAHDAVRISAQEGARVVASGPDVNDLNAPGLMALGAEEVVDSAQLVARIGGLLPRLV